MSKMQKSRPTEQTGKWTCKLTERNLHRTFNYHKTYCLKLLERIKHNIGLKQTSGANFKVCLS